jgi:hypothetical protein
MAKICFKGKTASKAGGGMKVPGYRKAKKVWMCSSENRT